MEICNIIDFAYLRFRINTFYFLFMQKLFLEIQRNLSLLPRRLFYISVHHFGHFILLFSKIAERYILFYPFFLIFCFFVVILYNINYFSRPVNGIILNIYGKMLDIYKRKLRRNVRTQNGQTDCRL